MSGPAVVIVVESSGRVIAQQVAETESDGLQVERLAQILAPEITRLREVVASALGDGGTSNERRAAA